MGIRLILFVVLAALLLALPPDASPSAAAERFKSELGQYVVQNPSAGYFDVQGRKSVLSKLTSPTIRRQAELLQAGASCKDMLAMPVITGNITVPMRQNDPAGWERLSLPFRKFEESVSLLAGAQFVAKDLYHGNCLIRLLHKWARARSLLDLDYSGRGLQTWFQAEATISAAALAYSIVRDEVPDMQSEKKDVEVWLHAAAIHHFSRKGGKRGSCCNNHLYRRAVYAAMIGVLLNEHELFRTGVSAVYEALADADPSGVLPLEMTRGPLAAHYQNFATMQLVLIAQIARRQGYDLYALEIDGKKLDTIINASLQALKNPDWISPYAGGERQTADFISHRMYRAWLDMLPHSENRAVDVGLLLNNQKPRYNRSLGGYTTLYFSKGNQ
jgi:poly(beta-D-mannuronate) lyase